jgi:glutaredoxin-like protein
MAYDFMGLPYGYEFKPLIEDIINVSKGETNLSEETKEKLRKVNRPIHIQVFVSLTCPYCPIATSLAHKFAFENDYIKSDMVEISEFPHLAQKYSVMGVPKIVINETIEFLGVLPEDHFVEHVLLAMKQSPIYV